MVELSYGITQSPSKRTPVVADNDDKLDGHAFYSDNLKT